jgi:hypothetical protein
MTLIKKCDVKDYRSLRAHKALRPFRTANEAGLTRSSKIEADEAKANPPGFVADFLLEHSSSGESAVPTTLSIHTESEFVPGTAANPGP